MVHKALETIIAFANTEGGNLVLGVEDVKKAQGADRRYARRRKIAAKVVDLFCNDTRPIVGVRVGKHGGKK